MVVNNDDGLPSSRFTYDELAPPAVADNAAAAPSVELMVCEHTAICLKALCSLSMWRVAWRVV